MIDQEVVYERNLTGSYMKIEAVDCSEFDEQMMLAHKVRGTLPVERCYFNSEAWYWYNISGKQSLDMHCKMQDLDLAFIEKIILSICDEIDILEWNLFDLNCLLLDPAFIYINNLNQEILFTVFPGGKEELAQQFQELMEYLLTKVDHSDSDAVRAAYGIYERTLDESYGIMDVRDYIVEERSRRNLGENPVQGDGSDVSQSAKEPYSMSYNGGQIGYGQQSGLGENFNAAGSSQDANSFSYRNVDSSYHAESSSRKVAAAKKEKKKTAAFAKKKEPMGIREQKESVSDKLLAEITMLFENWKVSLLGDHYGKAKKETSKNTGSMRKGKITEIRANASETEPSNTFTFTRLQPYQDYDSGGQSQMQLRVSEAADIYGSSPEAESKTTCLSDYKGFVKGMLIYEGADGFASIHLPQQDASIGKSAAAQIQIPKDTISQMHARASYRDGSYYLEDLNSTNGTYVNGEALAYKEVRELKLNDLVRFADVSYRFL